MISEKVDLFEHPELMPAPIKEIFDRYSEETGGDLTYQQCEAMLQECQAHGYTFEYYLDAVPYNLMEQNY